LAEGLAVEYPGRRGWGGLGPAAPPFLALSEVSLAIDPGETVALVGESGSGKTTLGRCLLALLAPSAGQVRFQGADLASLAPHDLRRLRRRFQPIFQDPSQALPPHRRVRSIVAEPLVIHEIGTAGERTERVVAALSRVGLGPELLERLPHELSGGQRQRVAIARAFVAGPELVVADEPVSALDASVRRGILRLLAELRRELGLALVLVSHDLAWLEELAQRVAVLYAGRLVEIGSAAAVLQRPGHPYTASLVAATPRLTGADRPQPLVPPGGALAPPDPRAVGCAFEPRCPRRQDRCRVARPSLASASAGGSKVACHFPLD
jgi:peptide/nickel transport system ATP-binding protein